MKCKNCHTELADSANFCHACGAKVITERVNTKLLVREFFANFLGWDNSFFKTLKNILLKPDWVINAYLNGVRKRYVSPFIFVAIGTALAMLIFNYFSGEFIEYSNSINEKQIELILESFEEQTQNQEMAQQQMDLLQNTDEIQKVILKYFNIVTFLLLPFYTLISYLVFGKKFNYGEHLVINCYIQGLNFFIGLLLFVTSIFTNPAVYYTQLLIVIFYYLFTYSRLLNYGWGKTILKLFVFFLVLLLMFIFIIILFIIAALINIIVF